MAKRQREDSIYTPTPEAPSVYVVRMVEGWGSDDAEDRGYITVKNLCVFAHVIHANDYARRWLQHKWPAHYQYGDGEPEREKPSGGIQLFVRTYKRDGSVMIDVEKHAVQEEPLVVQIER
ncbi:MAG: hypothetical protein L6R40_005331 [Gallowayella cf. fulva]|nr:MAG: hypothetical protein L6R40_005331 [Xanthomendoza cf. fulva]